MLAAALGGCTESADRGVGPEAVFEPETAQFWRTPWPSDARRDPDGTIDLGSFPDPYDAVLLGDYLARGDRLDGFGTNAPIYVPLEGPVDELAMPTVAEALDDPDASVILVDIDPTSAFRGERFPLQWAQNTFTSSRYMPEHLLSVAPMYGFPLRPATKYALILTTDVVRRNDRWSARLEPSHPERDRDLADALDELELDPDRVAIATTFTTLDPLDEMTRVADHVQRQVAPSPLDLERLQIVAHHDSYISWRTRYLSPVYTEGDPPYASEGGRFAFDASGKPRIVRWDEMRLAVCTPRGPAPPEGWPVVIYQHGTGGHYRGFCNSDEALEVMSRLGVAGLVGLGIDQTLHGTRPGAAGASDLAHFNLLNPDSGVTNFRQGAVDALYLARSLAVRAQVFRTATGETFRTDPDRVFFMGHSQGGLTGAIAAPYLGHDVRAMVLSGVGAVLAITVLERKDVIDFEDLVRRLVELEPEEPFTTMHPVLGVIQTLVEPTDPANYAPYWFAQRGSWAGHSPVSVLLTSGTEDAATPYRTAIALAAAARMPLAGDPATLVDAVRLRSGEPRPLPQSLNALAFDRKPTTAGFSQWRGGTHWVVFQQEAASDLYVDYLRSAADGRPSLGR